MSKTNNWSLRDVVDLESLLDGEVAVTASEQDAVAAETVGLSGVRARRAGLRCWLRLAGGGVTAGQRFGGAVGVVGVLVGVVFFLLGIAGVWGLRDVGRGGVHAPLFLVVLVGVQWLVLVVAFLAWLARGRVAGGSLWLRAVVARLVLKFAGQTRAPWWGRLLANGGAERDAITWRLVRMVQAGGVFFNLGIVAGLSALVLVRHVGFYWETTTQLAMRDMLVEGTRWLSLPWAAWLPSAVPDAQTIAATRWVPGMKLAPGPDAWWEFLLMCVLVWGLMPRLLMWILAWAKERAALARIDFQARHHRELWRKLTGPGRSDPHDAPVDGVLVFEVGGQTWNREAMRPFLLRHLRVNPTSWHSVAVLDGGAEAEATAALAKAPAGVVLLAEGWALSPARMKAIHARVRKAAGEGTPVKFLVANVESGQAAEPTPEERKEWEKFVDSLRDAEAEVFFYEE